jgi:hypothetical protein
MQCGFKRAKAPENAALVLEESARLATTLCRFDHDGPSLHGAQQDQRLTDVTQAPSGER